MSKVALVTDSTTYLPHQMMEGLNITVIPALVIWEGETFKDGIDIQPTEFYTRLSTAKEIPTTAQPTPQDFKTIYEKLIGEGYDILSIHVSHHLSGTMASAEQAKTMFPDANIEVLDGLSVGMGTGYPILGAARAARDGASLAECAELAAKCSATVGLYLVPETLEFLARGGRLGGAQRLVGTALNLKPILYISEGRIETLKKVRTKGKAMNQIVDIVVENTQGKENLRLSALHANSPEHAQMMLDKASERLNPVETVVTALSPGVGVHAGPGTVALAYTYGV